MTEPGRSEPDSVRQMIFLGDWYGFFYGTICSLIQITLNHFFILLNLFYEMSDKNF
jgi:hypothetical protein